MKQPRIVFTGAQNTGKTTLAKEIAQRHNMNFVTGLSRSSPYAQTSLNKKSSLLNQFYLMTALAAHTNARRNTISDRAPLDSYIYTLHSYMNNSFEPPGEYEIDERDIEWMYKFISETMLNYDLVVYFPAYDWPITLDGVRDPDTKYRYEISNMIHQALGWMQIPYQTVPDISTKERVELIESWIA